MVRLRKEVPWNTLLHFLHPACESPAITREYNTVPYMGVRPVWSLACCDWLQQCNAPLQLGQMLRAVLFFGFDKIMTLRTFCAQVSFCTLRYFSQGIVPRTKNNSKGLKYYPKWYNGVEKRILAFLRPCIKGPEDYTLMISVIGMSVNVLRLIVAL